MPKTMVDGCFRFRTGFFRFCNVLTLNARSGSFQFNLDRTSASIAALECAQIPRRTGREGSS